MSKDESFTRRINDGVSRIRATDPNCNGSTLFFRYEMSDLAFAFRTELTSHDDGNRHLHPFIFCKAQSISYAASRSIRYFRQHVWQRPSASQFSVPLHASPL